eukprot:11201583-Heterocapsa_arctica.AAC.1
METVCCVEIRTQESITCGGNAEHSTNMLISVISNLCILDTKQKTSHNVSGHWNCYNRLDHPPRIRTYEGRRSVS